MTPAKAANHCCKCAFRVLLEILSRGADRGGAFAAHRMTVTRQQPNPSDDGGRVVPFRSRGARTSGATQQRPQSSSSPEAVEIIQMRKNQDCILSGRRNCAPIDLTAPER
jgi:hypothetical protein